MPFVYRWCVNWNRSYRNDRLRNSLYKILNNFLRDSETTKPSAFLKIQTVTVIFTKTSKQGSDVLPVHADDLFENVAWSK